MKQAARRWQERFTQNHWRNDRSTNKTMAIIKGLGTAANWPCINTLKIPGARTVPIQPLAEVDQHARYLVGMAQMNDQRRSRMGDTWRHDMKRKGYRVGTSDF